MRLHNKATVVFKLPRGLSFGRLYQLRKQWWNSYQDSECVHFLSDGVNSLVPSRRNEDTSANRHARIGYVVDRGRFSCT